MVATDALKEFAFFKGFTEVQLEKLASIAVEETYRAGAQMYKKGAYFANPAYAQIHPTCIPVHGEFQSKLTLMSESLRNDGRIWVPKKKDDNRPAVQIPEDERDYYLERKYGLKFSA